MQCAGVSPPAFPKMRLIDPVRDLSSILQSVEKPARYVGGEYGSLLKDNAALSVAISYPDLYEIGMSNNAVRILYNILNALPDVQCERVFAPAPDFEARSSRGGHSALFPGVREGAARLRPDRVFLRI